MNLWNDPDKDFWFEVTQIVVHLTHIFDETLLSQQPSKDYV